MPPTSESNLDSNNLVRKLEKKDFWLVKQIKPSIDEATFSERLQRQSLGEIEFLILLDDETPVCFGVMSLVGKPTHPEYPDLFDLYTREESRGKGYGSILIQEAEKRAKELGFNQIGLAVNPTLNPKAKALYEKLGYRSTGEREYLDGVYDGTEDWVIDMVKEI